MMFLSWHHLQHHGKMTMRGQKQINITDNSLCDLEHLSSMYPPPILTPSDLQISLVIERVTGDTHNIQIFSVFVQPLEGYLRSIADYACRFELQVLLAIFNYVANEFCLQEGFSAGYIDFHHARISQQFQTTFGILGRKSHG